MGSIRSYSFGYQIVPPVPEGTTVNIKASHVPLVLNGLNIPVLVSTASFFQLPNNPQSVKSTQILAHFDTGANKTSIDTEIAKLLNLVPIGESPSHTAAGLRQATDFVIDLSFPGTNLNPFRNLQISSCVLTNPNLPPPFKMLIGRDVMSRWNVIWDGPTSSVIIND